MTCGDLIPGQVLGYNDQGYTYITLSSNFLKMNPLTISWENLRYNPAEIMTKEMSFIPIGLI